MSYSRWSNSSWYVFWNASSGFTRESQVLSAWYSLDKCIDWTFNEVDTLLSSAFHEIVPRLEMKYGCSGDEATELQEIMQIWRSDVKSEFIA